MYRYAHMYTHIYASLENCTVLPIYHNTRTINYYYYSYYDRRESVTTNFPK